MKLRKLDDYQSWLLEFEDDAGAPVRVLMDPWLSERYVAGGAWLLSRSQGAPWIGLDELDVASLDYVLLSAHFADHLDPETLGALPEQLPILATPFAAKLLRRRGHASVEALSLGEPRTLAPGVELLPVQPGWPYRHNSMGYCIHEHRSGRRVYVETHVTHKKRLPQLRAGGPVDVAVLPVESVRLLGLPIVMGGARSLEAVTALEPRWVLPTGLEPQNTRGLLGALLSTAGSARDFADRLRESESNVEFVELEPGASFTVPARA